MKLLIIEPILGAVILLSGCAAGRTTIQSSWTDSAYAGPPLDRVAVVALFDTRADSLAFERSASDYFAMRGVATVPGHELLTPVAIERIDETQIRERLAATNVDGVLIFRLVDIDKRREYQVPDRYPPNAPSDGVGSGFCSLPSQSTPVNGSQGYWIEQDFVVAETALFDNRTDRRLLWTAKSETLDDAHSRHTSESIVRAVARQLFAMDLIARTNADVPSGAARTLQPG